MDPKLALRIRMKLAQFEGLLSHTEINECIENETLLLG